MNNLTRRPKVLSATERTLHLPGGAFLHSVSVEVVIAEREETCLRLIVQRNTHSDLSLCPCA